MTAYEEQLWRSVAEHEAGHCAAAVLLGLRVSKVAATKTKTAELEQAPADMDRPVGGTWVQPDGLGEIETRAMATIVLCGRMVEQHDDGSSWPPPFTELVAPQGWTSPDHRQLAGHVKALQLGERGYQRMVTEALRLCCSDEFTRLHRALDYALRENDGTLDEKDIAAIREKARIPQPEPPEDVERDELGIVSDEQVDRDIDSIRAARAIAANGDGGPSDAEVKKDAYTFALKAFEAGKVEVASFSC